MQEIGLVAAHLGADQGFASLCGARLDSSSVHSVGRSSQQLDDHCLEAPPPHVTMSQNVSER